jgi:hypothetical protein
MMLQGVSICATRLQGYLLTSLALGFPGIITIEKLGILCNQKVC